MKPDCLVVKTAPEIFLKSHYVAQFFMKKLSQNIKTALKKNEISCKKTERARGRMFLYCTSLPKSAKILLRVFGIHAVATAESHSFSNTSALAETISEKALQATETFFEKNDTFAVRATKAEKKVPSAREIEIHTGAAINQKFSRLNLKVNLSSPKKTIFIEVVSKKFFIYFSEEKGAGGLPLGVEGNAAMMFEGKQEELAAAFLMMKRGCSIFPVVKKKIPALETHLHKLAPWNCFRDFEITEEKNMQELFERKNIQAIITADSGTSETNLGDYGKFNEKNSMLVLRPLLLYPKDMFKEKMELINSGAL